MDTLDSPENDLICPFCGEAFEEIVEVTPKDEIVSYAYCACLPREGRNARDYIAPGLDFESL